MSACVLFLGEVKAINVASLEFIVKSIDEDIFKQAKLVATTKLINDWVGTHRKYKDHYMQRRMLEHHVTLPIYYR